MNDWAVLIAAKEMDATNNIFEIGKRRVFPNN